jgi:hypothetical protein
MHFLRGVGGNKARFLRCFALYLAGEKRRAEEAVELTAMTTGRGTTATSAPMAYSGGKGCESGGFGVHSVAPLLPWLTAVEKAANRAALGCTALHLCSCSLGLGGLNARRPGLGGGVV